jgi:hypothetical protein
MGNTATSYLVAQNRVGEITTNPLQGLSTQTRSTWNAQAMEVKPRYYIFSDNFKVENWQVTQPVYQPWAGLDQGNQNMCFDEEEGVSDGVFADSVNCETESVIAHKVIK